VLGVSEPLKEFSGRCIAVIHRAEEEDDKLIVVPDGARMSESAIRRMTAFQERFFSIRVEMPGQNDQAT